MLTWALLNPLLTSDAIKSFGILKSGHVLLMVFPNQGCCQPRDCPMQTESKIINPNLRDTILSVWFFLREVMLPWLKACEYWNTPTFDWFLFDLVFTFQQITLEFHMEALHCTQQQLRLATCIFLSFLAKLLTFISFDDFFTCEFIHTI